MSSPQIPQTMRAWVQTEDNTLAIQETPVPQPMANQVLIKVEYAAQNPTDWKHAEFLSLPGVINGCDYAGTVVKVGSNLKTPLKVGDKVAGTVHGGYFKDEGSYADYATVDSDMCFVVPEGMKLEDAATFGVAWVTACQTIVQRQGKAFPPGDTKVSGNPWYIIYGASTSVGLFGIQVAKSLGYKVLGVCSPHSFDLAKSYGADATVSYHDQEKAIVEALKITDGGAEYALDTISEGDTFRVTIGMMGKKGKQLNCILAVPDEVKQINPNLKVEWSLMYTLFGVDFIFTPRIPNSEVLPASKEDRAFGEETFAKTPELITKFGVKPNPVVIAGGFEDVIKALDALKNGKVSGKKQVIKISA
ncbi:enoyl reductase [Cryptococcus neoformans C23]|uniref:Enoyl reductase n=1 Tax=Cryptococcus neoformans (strain H99 / ATCC 208821 / CBS 10515 / FGSC 9487) TaxID=235443 RepID=J9W0J1_CRYN9|nr:enoyl reductase [Cryptococcus neoformans var. grubii H99]AUB27598.1 enoyl reductase [Cryptococcus neoformans var. grubii]OWZ28170.1 enoyl reductase [Cryptococcus neoformans var. grubii AD2-60a]OWZ40485.1 enoyl reductase [Cryptococcus neoformans var. grubii C23]OWZ51386.1 enoyl reductase [Cryptococcus neoformans var. grubii 125.91]OXC82298.1 enoyl reductase [Cryptococcus neoformans var. grubii AD1-7a]OXG28140.1 enoyl reductase [Cryptococcus neoformans var. grubii Bt15]OXG35666.1 enoyl redu|eukprot:XP_012052121.1 enoyl reductase [Cryptococcus neoformans var. grubii H99]